MNLVRTTLCFLLLLAIGWGTFARNESNEHLPHFQVTDLGTLGGTRSDARALNSRGEVVGQSQTSTGAYHAFLWCDGVMKDLGTLGGDQSFALGINEREEIVGQSLTASGDTHAFLYRKGAMTDLGTLGGNGSAAFAINNRGEIVGETVTSGVPRTHAFLYKDGVMTDLGTLSTALTTASIAVSINDDGDAVGESGSGLLGSEVHGFLYSHGSLKDLGTLGGAPSNASGISDRGEIVGFSDLPSGGPHAFLYRDGVMRDLGTLVAGNPASTVSVAFGINDEGEIVGYSQIAGTSPPNHVALWKHGQILDVTPQGWQGIGYAINNRGQIAGTGSNPTGQQHGFLLTHTH